MISMKKNHLALIVLAMAALGKANATEYYVHNQWGVDSTLPGFGEYEDYPCKWKSISFALGRPDAGDGDRLNVGCTNPGP